LNQALLNEPQKLWGGPVRAPKPNSGDGKSPEPIIGASFKSFLKNKPEDAGKESKSNEKRIRSCGT